MRASFYYAENDVNISRCSIQSIHMLLPVQVYDVAEFGVSTDDIASGTLVHVVDGFEGNLVTDQ